MKPIPQMRKEVGPYIIDYLRADETGGEGAHEVHFPDGRKLRSLPDGRTTTKKRSHTILSGLTTLHYVELESGTDQVDDLDPCAYMIGLLEVVGADEWKMTGIPVSAETVISEFISDWDSNGSASKLLGELEEAGYRLVRSDAE